MPDLKASVSFTADGTTKKYYFNFDYINPEYIKVNVGGTELSYPSDYSVIDRAVELKVVPAKDTLIRIYRQTPSNRIIEWADGSFIKASQMTLGDLQQLHLIEEAQDYPILNGISTYPDGENFNAVGRRIINVADPVNPQDAVTKNYMESVQDGFVQRNTAIENNIKAMQSDVTTKNQQAQQAKDTAQKWAESPESPDTLEDTESPTGKTQSAKGWSLTGKQWAKDWAMSDTSPDGLEDADSDTGKTQSAKGWAQQAKDMAQRNIGLNVLQRNKEYAVGDIAYSPLLPSWARLECITAGTTGAEEPAELLSTPPVDSKIGLYITDGTVTWIVDDVRDGTPIGSVRGSLYLPKGYIKANGATVNRADYPRLVKFITDNNLWTDDVTGNLGLFGKGDESTTFVVPNYVGRMVTYKDTGAGQTLDAGLPNITGESGTVSGAQTNVSQGDPLNPYDKGAFVRVLKKKGVGYTTNDVWNMFTLNIDASRSNAIYGASDTVQPPAISLIPVIRY
ncbi:phage tail fiber protein [Megasphaera sp. SW808]|uniref:phage tail fiber domain-containing protein n=1 Tax=Megasphaera sp. SW808 TaxID=2530045 RepID=UPI00143940F9